MVIDAQVIRKSKNLAKNYYSKTELFLKDNDANQRGQ
jgi:hypothetical protein